MKNKPPNGLYLRGMKLQEQASLKSYNTFGLDIKANQLMIVNSVEELKELSSKSIFTKKHFILGGGSNVLFTGDFHGLVVLVNLKGIFCEYLDDDHVLVKAMAGENWHQLVLWAIERNYGGIENLSLIPGTVGAAPMQNIGAYGVEIKDCFYSLDALNKQTGEMEVFHHEDCGFGYRESVFKNKLKDKYVICSVSLKLRIKDHELNTSYGALQSELENLGVEEANIQDISKAVINIRQSKLPNPSEIGNSGSFFKNPIVSVEKLKELQSEFKDIPSYPWKRGTVKLAAGWLIEQCGWKGKKVGNTGAHSKQALVLVNHGDADGKEVYALAMNIKASVAKKFGVVIEPEVNVV